MSVPFILQLSYPLIGLYLAPQGCAYGSRVHAPHLQPRENVDIFNEARSYNSTPSSLDNKNVAASEEPVIVQ
jgi:hypothetical protein